MNTLQLNACMNWDQHIHSEKGGVYSSNTLSLIVKDKPKFFISYVDPNFMHGSHWVVIYCLPNGISEYFDSLGAAPS